MRNRLKLKLIFYLACILMLAGCGSAPKKKTLEAQDYKYQQNAIHISYQASKSLNKADGDPHTLQLTIIQLRDLSNIRPQLTTKSRVLQLLGSLTKEHPKWYIEQYYVTPGKTKTLKLPRMSHKKHVVVIAAYYDLNPDQSVKIYDVPIVTIEHGWIFSSITRKPGELKVDLKLGPHGIVEDGDVDTGNDTKDQSGNSQKQDNDNNSKPSKHNNKDGQ